MISSVVSLALTMVELMTRILAGTWFPSLQKQN